MSREYILYGVELTDNTIVGSGSVVDSSFDESNNIITGNPVRKTSILDSFRDKYENKAAFRSELDGMIQGSIEKLICK